MAVRSGNDGPVEDKAVVVPMLLRKNQMLRWIRAPEQTLYNERTCEIFPGVTLYLDDKGKLGAHQRL